VTTAAQMVNVWPEARHKVKAFKVIDSYGEMYGTDPDIIATDEEAQAKADAEAQAAQGAAAADNAQKLAAAAQSAGATPLATGGTVLDSLTGGGAPA
jgi:hypothetical protein